MFSASTRRALVAIYWMWLTISFTIPNKMCKKISNIQKNAHFLNKRHICCFKHCLQMFMHIISIKCGPAAAGIIRGALYTGGVQTDGALRYRFFLKWQGTTEEEEKAGQLYTPRTGLRAGSLFLKTSRPPESWDETFSTKVMRLRVWSAVSTQLLMINLSWKEEEKKKILQLVQSYHVYL